MKTRRFGTTLLSLVLMLSLITGAPASAAQLRASQYFSLYTATMQATGGGNIQVSYTVVATGTADEVGATQIIVQRKNGSAWTNVTTFSSSANPSLIGTNCISHTSYVIYNGTSGQIYRAVVTMYVRIGSGSGSTNYTTNTVTA
jgi:hypothetical protein